MAENNNTSTTIVSETDLVQIIKGDLSFDSNLSNVLDQWGVLGKGFDYQVVAILGCQSSGKSTLLNKLFKTTFQVMDADSGRSQTTVGIWLGKAQQSAETKHNVETLVLDVEGTDSRERGEDAMNYERKTSLFSLALAEILLINLWAADIGRYNAANYSLLKIVFELNLQLFQRAKTGKTLILFVIRDHVRTPLEKLTGLLEKDMSDIWSQLNKPPEYVQSNVTDFFDFGFTSLPHKELEPEKFEESAVALRDRFINPSNDNYIWKSTYKTDVPADGWPQFANKVWETIKENKDLDLPSQKEMLAMFRCEEISENVYHAFSDQIAPLSKSLEKNLLEDFGEKTTSIMNASLAQYDLPASRYHAEVSARKRENLVSRILRDLRELFSLQLTRLQDEAINFMNSRFAEEFKGTTCVPNFNELANKIKDEVITFFKARADRSIVEGSNWTYDSEIQTLNEAINSRIAKEKETQLKLLTEGLKADLKTVFVNPISKLLDSAPNDMWAKIRRMYSDASENILNELISNLKGFEPSEQELEERKKSLQEEVFGILKEKVKEKANMLLYKMEKRFDELFRLDHEGLPRRWNPGDDVGGIFNDSRKKAAVLIDQFAILRLEESLDQVSVFAENNDETISKIDGGRIILSIDECNQLNDRFKRQAEAAYYQALRDQEGAGLRKNQPIFLIILLLILGFNEIMYVLSSPLLLVAMCFTGVIVFIVIQLNLHKIIQPMVEPVINQVSSKVTSMLPGGGPTSEKKNS